jgi:hypothetical protein
MSRFTACSVVSFFLSCQRIVPFCPAGRSLAAALVLSAIPLTAAAQQVVVDKIVAQEQAEVELLRQYSPLVETYIQYLRPDKRVGTVPNGDKYFLGRADLAKGVGLEPLEHTVGLKHKVSGGIREFFPRSLSRAASCR